MNAKHLLAFVPFLLFACTATEEETGASLDKLTAGRGQMCGGFAGTLCAEGLRCNYQMGGAGRCVDNPNAASQGVDEGEVCGGAANIKCKADLACKTQTGATPAPGGKGKCFAVSVQCQAFPSCDVGHNAVASADDCLDGDAACYKRTMCGRSIWCTGTTNSSSEPAEEDTGAARGEPCGGFAGITCASGLRCDNSRGLNAGYCR
jgi:hypothetical protein